jgi:PhnB protein
LAQPQQEVELNMKTVSPYLNFPGHTLTAFEHYQSIFGGELRVVRFRDMPAMNPPPHALDKVVNVSLELISGASLMGSDAIEGFGPPLKVGNNFSIALETASAKETDTLFGKLSAGGEVTMPLGETDWAERFGMCKDKFGVQWMLNFTGKKQFQAG